MDTRSVMFNFIQGSDITGHSSYDIWKSLNPEGTEAEFLKSLKGESAYESWLKQEGNAGKTEAEFLDSLGGGVSIDRFNSEVAELKSADAQTLTDAKAYADEKITAQKTAYEAADAQILKDAKAYTDTEVAALVGAAPETMNTLEELGNLLKTNEDAVDALNQAIGNRVLNTTYTTKVSELEAADAQTLTDAKAYTDVQVAAINNTFVKKGVISVALSANGWTGTSAPYSQTVTVSGITASDDFQIVSMLANGATEATQKAYNKAFGVITSGTGSTAAGSATFKVYKKPETDITVGLRFV